MTLLIIAGVKNFKFEVSGHTDWSGNDRRYEVRVRL
jgi:hypothetical protein